MTNFEGIKDTSQLNEDFIKNCSEESDEGCLIKSDAQYLKKLHELNNILPFLPERMKTEKVENLLANSDDKTKYFVHIRNLKQAVNHGSVFKKVHRVIRFNQNPWLKPYIDMNTNLRKTSKNDFEKYFFKLMNNADFGTNTENLGKQRNIKLTATENTRNYLKYQDQIIIL